MCAADVVCLDNYGDAEFFLAIERALHFTSVDSESIVTSILRQFPEENVRKIKSWLRVPRRFLFHVTNDAFSKGTVSDFFLFGSS